MCGNEFSCRTNSETFFVELIFFYSVNRGAVYIEQKVELEDDLVYVILEHFQSKFSKLLLEFLRSLFIS